VLENGELVDVSFDVCNVDWMIGGLFLYYVMKWYGCVGFLVSMIWFGLYGLVG